MWWSVKRKKDKQKAHYGMEEYTFIGILQQQQPAQRNPAAGMQWGRKGGEDEAAVLPLRKAVEGSRSTCLAEQCYPKPSEDRLWLSSRCDLVFLLHYPTLNEQTRTHMNTHTLPTCTGSCQLSGNSVVAYTQVHPVPF